MFAGSLIFETPIDTTGVETGAKEIKGEFGGLKKVAAETGKAINDAFSGNFKKSIASAQARVTKLEQQLKTVNSDLDRFAKSGITPTNSKEANALVAEQTRISERLATANEKLLFAIQEAEKKSAAKAEQEHRKSFSNMSKAFGKMEKTANRFGTRLRSVISGALVFNLISSGLRELTSYFGSALKSNKEFTTQLAKLKGALLTAFQPIYEYVLPALTKLMQGITSALIVIGNFFASIFGKSYKQIAQNAQALYDQSSTLDSVGAAAKDAKKQLAGFDQINKLENSDTKSGGGSSSSISPDFSASSQISPELEKILEYATAIAAAFAGWKIASGLSTIIGEIARKLGEIAAIGGGAGVLAIAGFVSDLNLFIEYIEDIKENGADLTNVSGAIAELIGMIGDIGIIAGQTSLGGALKAVQAVGEIVSAISDMSENGINWGNVGTTIKGVTNAVIAIGFLTKNYTLVGVGYTSQGILTVIDEVKKIIEACKTGDWESVNWVNLAIGGIMSVGGIIVAISNLNKKSESLEDAGDASPAIEAVESANTSTSALSTQLKSFAKTLGWAIVVITETAAAAGILVGAIALIGWELEQVGKTWEPVIKNARTVSIAVGTGTALLAAIGTACYFLGQLGATAATNIGIGALIMLEIGAAAAAFLAEIWAVGWGLDQIGQAWEPVLINGENIATAIGIGTGLLIGIGAVSAALGAATVASAGLLPAAIGLGTALLVELAVAFVLFVESLVAVASELSDNLSPALESLNPKIPKLTDHMSDFVDFMTDFANEFVRYAGVSVVSGLAATIDKIIGWFLEDPIQSMSDEVHSQHTQFQSLLSNLEKAIPDIEKSIELVTEYNDLMDEFQIATNAGNSKPTILTFLSDVVCGVWDAIKDTINKIIGGIEGMTNFVIQGLNGMIGALNKLSFDVPDWVPGIGGEKFGFNIKTISPISIPRLAKGAVIPPNREFLAVLGDQKHGTNIEAPLSTIQEAVANVMQEYMASNMAGHEATVAVLRELLEAVLGITIGDDVIANAVDRYNRKMAVVRGG